jgi:hypothetical protein
VGGQTYGYSMTSSARAMSIGGTTIPGAVAVLRLNGSGPAPTCVAIRRAHVAYRHHLMEQLAALTELREPPVLYEPAMKFVVTVQTPPE